MMIEEILKKQLMMMEEMDRRLRRLEDPSKNKFDERKEWSQFETDLILEDIKEIVMKRGMSFGRSSNSIMWKIWREVGKLKI